VQEGAGKIHPGHLCQLHPGMTAGETLLIHQLNTRGKNLYPAGHLVPHNPLQHGIRYPYLPIFYDLENILLG